MDYPKEIYLDSETEAALLSYLDIELVNHEAERGIFIADIESWQQDYYVRPNKKERTFPFKGASNIIVPLTAITVETVHARNMMTAFGLKQFVDCKLNPNDDSLSDPLGNYLTYECIDQVGMYKTADNALLELEKFGTGIIKTGWNKTIRTAVREVGGQEQEFEVTTKQGPTADAVALANFVMPFTCQDAQTARWCGEYHMKTLEEVNQMEQSGLFRKGTYDKIKNYYTQTYQAGGAEYLAKMQSMTDQQPSYPKYIQWYELWMAFDTDKSEKLKEIVLHYHRQSRTFLSIRYNWYEDLHRPYRKGNYFTLEHRWNGIGIAKQQDQFQKEVTIQHRQRLDSGTMANARMIKVKNLSNYGPNEPFFPGKIWVVDDMADVESFQLGDLPTSAFSNENSTLMFSQQRSGVNDLNMGMPQAGTPGTATSDLARVQEGSKRFDYTYKNIKNWMGEVIIDIACNIAQYGPSSTRYFEIYPEGPALKDFFARGVSDLREQLLGKIELAGSQANKLLDRQNYTQIMQIVKDYYASIIQLAMQTQNQQLLAQAIPQSLAGSNVILKQYLETFDFKQIEKILIQLTPPASSNGNPQPVIGGAASGSPILSQAKGMGFTALPPS